MPSVVMKFYLCTIGCKIKYRRIGHELIDFRKYSLELIATLLHLCWIYDLLKHLSSIKTTKYKKLFSQIAYSLEHREDAKEVKSDLRKNFNNTNDKLEDFPRCFHRLLLA